MAMNATQSTALFLASNLSPKQILAHSIEFRYQCHGQTTVLSQLAVRQSFLIKKYNLAGVNGKQKETKQSMKSDSLLLFDITLKWRLVMKRSLKFTCNNIPKNDLIMMNINVRD